MKVIFVSRSKLDHGIPPIIENQGNSLKNEGIEIFFYTIKSGSISGYFRSLFEIRKLLKNNHFDLIHAHYGISGLITLFTSNNIPKVVSLMGSEILGANKLNGELSFKGKVITKIIKLSLKYYDAIIVKSKNMALEVVKFNPIIIPNGVSLKKFKPISKEKSRRLLKIDKRKIVLLFPANINRVEKNFLLFQNALKELKLDNIEVLWFNNISHEETLIYFNSADVVVLTSMHEGSPNVIKEAMACNLPIVSLDVGDVKEVIKNTRGCFISPNDPLSIAGNISKALKFGKRTKGRQQIQHLEESIIAKKIIELYYNKIRK